MKWQQGRRSSNVTDLRGSSGGGRRVPVAGGIVTLVVVIVGLFAGMDPADLQRLLVATEASAPRAGGGGGAPAADDAEAQFVSVVLASTEDTWPTVLREVNRSYPPPELTLFSGSVQSACGLQSSAVGPFYCPGDSRVYLDLTFFRELAQRFGAPGDFAEAYVIAHEVGHHVQNLLGVFEQMAQRGRGQSEAEANRLSVRQELQADCFAGIWGHYAAQRGLLDAGDVEEGLRAAAAIGDDRLQQQSRGYVVPESFTHGSSEQRVRWFRRGMESGRLDACDTLSGSI